MLRCDRLVWHRFLTVICLLVLYLSGPTPLAVALHEVEHRFTVYGTVRDGRTFPGSPVSGKQVVVRWSKTGKILEQGVTNQQGQYSIVLHVHDDDVGKLIMIQSQGIEKSVTLQFDPADKTQERRTRVDLIVLPQ